MPGSSSEHGNLVDRFAASFERLSDLTAYEGIDPVAGQLSFGEPDRNGHKRWRPTKVTGDRSSLEQIYRSLPVHFPRLFELLLLSYRWAEVDLRVYTLLANPPGRDLTGFLQQVLRDNALWECLQRERYLQFARGSGGGYDPVCFDTTSRKRNRDCPNRKDRP